ncbi:hypothetical protein Cadr_000017950 [Camelus dromedarius]|uniref:Uncharacterized protein n=1 Tax=Camelus dromedarius TaxID=9838 RepID=A0A5N4D700_CAMDR|nr:hypothetical protein Cadr_000017950 [Camelus dromedarius]
MGWRVCLTGLHQVFTLEWEESQPESGVRGVPGPEWSTDGHLDRGRFVCMKEEKRTGTGGIACPPLASPLPHQVEEDIPEVSPAVIGLSAVGPSDKGTARGEGQGNLPLGADESHTKPRTCVESCSSVPGVEEKQGQVGSGRPGSEGGEAKGTGELGAARLLTPVSGCGRLSCLMLIRDPWVWALEEVRDRQLWDREQYLLGSCFNALVPLALLHIQVQSGHHIHTHQLWMRGEEGENLSGLHVSACC